MIPIDKFTVSIPIFHRGIYMSFKPNGRSIILIFIEIFFLNKQGIVELRIVS